MCRQPTLVILSLLLTCCGGTVSDTSGNPTQGDTASGGDSVSGGGDAVVGGDNAVLGGDDAVAGGDNAMTSGDNAMAGGDNAVPGGDNAVAGGDNAAVGGDNAVAGGDNAAAGGDLGQPSFGTALSFFVSSTPVHPVTNDGFPIGDGNLVIEDAGGNTLFSGLAAADEHCRRLAAAAAVASGTDPAHTNWVAYLSTHGLSGQQQVDAIDRIGNGPWYNANGDVLLNSKTVPDTLDSALLHPVVAAMLINGSNRTQNPAYLLERPLVALMLDENGNTVNERSHDILTGSGPDGRVYKGQQADRWVPVSGTFTRTQWGTCDDWTSGQATADFPQTGHFDVPADVNFSPSWNSAHDSESCSPSGIRSRGGRGHVYCFAID